MLDGSFGGIFSTVLEQVANSKFGLSESVCLRNNLNLLQKVYAAQPRCTHPSPQEAPPAPACASKVTTVHANVNDFGGVIL